MSQNLECAACGKVYVLARFLQEHERRGCATSKRALSKIWKPVEICGSLGKRRRMEDVQAENLEAPPQARAKSIPITTRTSFTTIPSALSFTSTNEGPNAIAGPSAVDPLTRRNQVPGSSRVYEPPTSTLDEGSLAIRRPRRTARKPTRFHDDPPIPYTPFSCMSTTSSNVNDGQFIDQSSPIYQRGSEQHQSSLSHIHSGELEAPHSGHRRKWVSSNRNGFGFVRFFYMDRQLPIHDADNTESRDITGKHILPFPQFGPFANLSSFELGEWYWTSGGTLSFNSFSQLLAILKKKEFSIDDVTSTNWRQAFKVLGENKEALSEEEGDWIDDDGWLESDITIQIPFHSRTKNPGTETYVAGKLHHRSIVAVIREALSNPSRSRRFHFQPYRLKWSRHPSAPDIGVQGELYTSEAFLRANKELHDSVPEPGCSLERVVVALMFWSDGTLLASFGGAKLWPCYMYFGNKSKHRRTRGLENLCEHIAYFEDLRGSFNDYLRQHCEGKIPPETFTAFCKRLMFHAQWEILLDEELRHAMRHGIVIKCHDGVERRFYPRIFTYSADYPEKILIATVRNGGHCPCPRCTIPMTDFDQTATSDDRRKREELRRDPIVQEAVVQEACKLIYEEQKAIANKEVESLLKPDSWTPVVNVFSAKLGADNFNVFSTLVVDLLHDFEIGVWKNLFTHLIRILESSSTRSTGPLHSELNYRYRHTPTFGRSAIRKFSSCVALGKRRAARDYEDLLQCAIPAFEDLIPEPHNVVILKLLYLCAEWHALAKLRLHNDLTLRKLDNATTLMTDQFRVFVSETCSKIKTYELKSEQDARHRRTSRAKASGLDKGKGIRRNTDEAETSGRRLCKFNIQTYKFHALGDFVSTIEMFGTTDSFSTEVGEKDHCDPKGWFKRTNKKDYSIQIARIERRQARLRRIRDKLVAYQCDSQNEESAATEGYVPTSAHHTIGQNQNHPLNIQTFFRYNPDHPDPALFRFIPKLKIHLFSVLQKRLDETNGAASDLHLDWTSLALEHERIYNHKIMRIRYTTYDVRRAEDVVHVDTDQSNVMLINPDFDPRSSDQHPFRYAKVLGIFHANPYLPGSVQALAQPIRVDFLWVHWYEVVDQGRRFELDRLRFHPSKSPTAFGFIDPTEVIRSVHILPQFSKGAYTSNPSPKWIKGTLWKFYYVNRFADRDMFMRFLWGYAIGHTYTWKDQENGSAYYAVLEERLSSCFSQVSPTTPLPSPAAVSSSMAHTTNNVTEESAPTAYAGVGQAGPEIDLSGAPVRGPEQGREGGGEEVNEEKEDEWHTGMHEDWGEEDGAEDEDEWDLHDDEEVLAYYDMYSDWYIYS